MDVGMARTGNGLNSNYLNKKKNILSYGALTAGFFLLLLSYHDAMNDTFINGLGIIFTLNLKIMTETTHAAGK